MKDLLLLSVRKFLEERMVPEKPVLLGYSGGPDSKSLLYLLLDCRRFFPIDLHLVHVDHGWRRESEQEAEMLKEEARVLGLCFHLKTLSQSDFEVGNGEEQGRMKRLEFFAEIYAKQDAQALVLGHHADDQAEVVLKRIFEGASLFALGGLMQERLMHGMNLWRPLLDVSKQKVLGWLRERKLNFIEDPTNVSSSNLRGKMRGEILPLLNRAFGKQIAANLCRLGDESKQLKEYFSRLNRPILATAKKGFLDLNPFLPLPTIQLKYLLKEWLATEDVTFSREILEQAIMALLKGNQFITSVGKIQIEKGVIKHPLEN